MFGGLFRGEYCPEILLFLNYLMDFNNRNFLGLLTIGISFPKHRLLFSTSFNIFRRICTIQEKLFIQLGPLSFLQTKTANFFQSKINDSGRLRTTRLSSSWFGVRVPALPKSFTIYPQHFSIPEIGETLRGSPMEVFGTVRQKNFDGKS